MNELSLFSGVGGGLLGTKLIGFKTIGYVENEPYCQKVLLQRIRDGFLDSAPIFGDIRKFISEGYAESYQGMVDVLTAGFPCQPFSLAGKRKGESDQRNFWPDTIRATEIVNPSGVLLENVPGIRKYLPVVIRDLRRVGYTVKRPIIVAAAALGAGHIRKRIWIFAYNDCLWKQQSKGNISSIGRRDCYGSEKISAHDFGLRQREQSGRGTGKNRSSAPFGENDPKKVISSDNEHERLPQREGKQEDNGKEFEASQRNDGWRNPWWDREPGLARLVCRPPNRVDRIKATGNIQVPIVVATAWKILTGGIYGK